MTCNYIGTISKEIINKAPQSHEFLRIYDIYYILNLPESQGCLWSTHAVTVYRASRTFKAAEENIHTMELLLCSNYINRMVYTTGPEA